MSFYSSLEYYRPCPPPIVKGSDLARFVADVDRLKILKPGGFKFVKVKFGDSIDQDEDDMSASQPTGTGFYTIAMKEYDIDNQVGSIREIVSVLESEKRKVYRAHLALGVLVDAAAAPISRVGSPENQFDFIPGELSLEIGPINIAALNSDAIWRVGWISVGLHGYGYLFPWTVRDLVNRAESTPEIRQLANVCRSSWPVAAECAQEEDIEQRRQLGVLWPYDDLDRPWDWSWGVCETG